MTIQQAYGLIDELTDESVQIVIHDEDDIETKRIGIAKGKVLYNPDYDFDELNDEIAKMFEVS